MRRRCRRNHHRSPAAGRIGATTPAVLAVAVVAAAGLLSIAVLGESRDASSGPAEADVGYLSPLAVVADRAGAALYVAEATGRRVGIVDTAAGKVTGEIALPDPPGSLALAPDGDRLYVTADVPAGRVHVVDVKGRRVVAGYPVGHSPSAVAVSPDGRTLYVCNRFDNDVSVLDAATGRQVRRVAVAREPVAIAVTPDGRFVVVANHLPAGPANGPYSAAAVSIIAADTGRLAATVGLANGAIGVRGLCLSPDGRHAYATHILAHYQLPTTMVERGWMCTNALSIVDVPAGKLVATVLLDSVDEGAANPWSVACTADGRLLCVTHAGAHEVSVIDRPALHERLARAAAGQPVTGVSDSLADVPNDLGFLEGIRRRLKLPGNGPRGLALVGTRLFAAEYFSDTLGTLDVDPAKARPAAASIRLGPDRPLSPRRLGERCFNDAALCLQQWQSCASCHPDGRSDGLNWDLLNDGIGNPKNAKSLLLAHRTPPTMISGVRAKAEVAVRAGIRFIQFASRPEAEAAAIDAYLQSLRPVPSPRLVAGQLSDSARRGEALFRSAGCASCHAGELGTDLRSYDVGTGPDQLGIRELDTPTLVEVWRTAPYLYDGRAATVLEVLTRFNKSDRHGATSRLTPQQLADLAEYVLSR